VGVGSGPGVGVGSGSVVTASDQLVLAELRRSVSVAGTAWWSDPGTGTVTVAVDDTVTGSDLARLAGMTGRLGARLVHEPGVRTLRTAGGDLVFGPGGFRCTVGFNVRKSSTFYFLTAAHCVGAVGTPVFADPGGQAQLGVVAAVEPGRDYALVRYTDPAVSKPSAVNLYNGALQPITAVSGGVVGQAVTRASPVSGVRHGRITALNVTVNLAGGTITNLIRTTVCAEAGDSGGPLFAGSTAIGMTVGGSGNCATGGTTYFSSAARAMSQYGVGVY
jgi:streptogrisin D